MEEKTLHIAGELYPIEKVDADIVEAIRGALEVLTQSNKKSVVLK